MRIRYCKLNIKKVKRKFLSQAKKIYSIYRIQQVLFIHPTMSLFNEIQWQVIESPKSTYNNIKIRKEKKEKDNKENEKKKKQEWKKLCEQKKEELWEDEYKKRYWKQRYKDNREYHIQKEINRQREKKKEEDAMIEEIYKNVYDIIPEPIDIDKFYADKYDKDDRDGNNKYKFYRRCSRIIFMKTCKMKNYTRPIKIYNRWRLNLMFSALWKAQDRAYEYIKPHIEKLNIKDFKIPKEQFFTKSPMRTSSELMQKLISSTDIPNNQIYSVASALLRDKYIQTELYMGRLSFLVGDIIITQNGNILRPILENNIPWLTKDTVEELHQKRIDWLKRKTDDLKVYALWDCYFLKIQPNEWETLFYFTPT